MNRIYRLVFNRRLGVLQVASEHAGSHAGGLGAACCRRALPLAPLALSLMAGLGLWAGAAGQAQAQQRFYFSQDQTITEPLPPEQLNNKEVFIGQNSGDDVTVTVTGNGRLAATATNGGYEGYLHIGWWAGTKGALIVDGPGASVYAEKRITLGNSDGQGTLIVRNGGLVELGHNAPGGSLGGSGYLQIYENGHLQVEGPGSRVSADVLEVDRTVYGEEGEDTDGDILISDGASMQNREIYLRSHALDDTPAATLTGTGSTWAVSGYAEVGSLDVLDGATMSVGSMAITTYNRFDDNEPAVYLGGAGTTFTSSGTVAVKNGTLTVADGAALSVGEHEIQLGYSSDSTPGGLVFGGRIAWNGKLYPGVDGTAEPTAPGTLNPEATIRFMDDGVFNDGGLVFNHTSDDYVFSNTLLSDKVGSGWVYNLAGTTVLTSDLSAYSGGFIVRGGRLVIDSSVAMETIRAFDSVSTAGVQVVNGGTLMLDGTLRSGLSMVTSNYGYQASNDDPGGILAGTGALLTRSQSGAAGGLYVYDGGTIAPGHDGVGTLTIDGNLSLSYGSASFIGADDRQSLAPAHLDVDIKGDGTSDKLVVTGATVIGAAATDILAAQTADVRVTALDSSTSYQNGQQYTILTSDGGITGQFSGVSTNSAFLTTSLSYTTTSVLLTVGLIDTGYPDKTVASGETYTATGNVGALKVLSGGTLAMGGTGAIGALVSDDTLLFENGSTFAVDVKGDGSSDKLTTSGKATLQGGTVEVTALDPQTSYLNGQTYTILKADGGIEGTFAQVLSKSAFLTPSLSYQTAAGGTITAAASDGGTPTEVKLTIQVPGVPTDGGGDGGGGDTGGETGGGTTGPQIFQTVARTGNQYSTAVALNSLPQSGTALALYNSLLMLDADSARTAFGQLSGQVHADARGALLEDRFLRDGIDRHLQAGGQGPVSVWLDGDGRSSRLDADSHAVRSQTYRDGLMAGADMALGEHARLGVVAGSERLDTREPVLSARSKADSTQLGLYGQLQWSQLSVQLGVAHARYDIDSARSVVVGTSQDQVLSSSHDATSWSYFARAGWDIGLGSHLTLTPTLGYALTKVEADGFQEHGGSAALAVDGSDDDIKVASAGLRLRWEMADRTSVFAGLGWDHISGDRNVVIGNQLLVGGEAFAVQGSALPRSSVSLDAGVAVQVSPRSQVSFSAGGRRGDGLSEVSGRLQWQVAF